MANVLVIGSSNTDLTVLTPNFPNPGETVMGGTFHINAGGKGANQAVAAARLGANVTLIAKLGNDSFGERALEGFKAEGLDVSNVLIDEENSTGTALITVNSVGENTIVVVPGANNNLVPADLKKLSYLLSDNDVLLMQLEIPLQTVIEAAQQAYAHGRKVILNPAPATALPDELLKNLYMITPNETETETITGIKVTDEQSAEKAAREFKRRGVQNVIITLGSKGAWLSAGTIAKLLPAPKVKAVDTTAAGDVFSGALAHCLSSRIDIELAVEYACKAAAISVTRIGAQNAAPYASEII